MKWLKLPLFMCWTLGMAILFGIACKSAPGPTPPTEPGDPVKTTTTTATTPAK